MKICSKCKRSQDESEFCRRKNRKSGLSSHCRSCNRKSVSDWRKKNPTYQKDWMNKNPDYAKLDRRKRRRTNESYRVADNLRRRVNLALKGKCKSKSTEKLLGCSFEECKLYLESLFAKGMGWDNYGDWHIDHIRPCASFDLTDVKQQSECFHYTNLQPLWAKDNLIKKDKYDVGRNKILDKLF